MKFQILKTEFLEALQATQGIVEKKNVMPILSHLLIEAEKDSPLIKISATDLEVTVCVLAQARTLDGGKITVFARSLYDIVRESPVNEITVATGENERVEILSGHSHYKVVGLPAKEFPGLPEVSGKTTRVSGETFCHMYDKVSFAVSLDEARYHLNGLLMEKAGQECVMVATDGHRLSFIQKPFALNGMQQDRVIIPRKGAAELRKLLAHEKSFDLCVGDRYVYVKTEKQTNHIRLLDGNFPDYRRVIPAQNTIKIEVPRDVLLGALKRVSILSSERSRGVMLYFCNNLLSVSSSTPELGEAREDVELSYKGPVMNIGFNAKYLIDVLGVVSDETVTLAFLDELSPCLITCPSETGFQSVVMPMRI